MIVNLYNALKGLWSWFMFAASPQLVQRRPVPRFNTPKEAADYLERYFVYTGDLAGGALDTYTHPEALQYSFETGTQRALHVDCDDVACWAFVALLAMGATPTLYTLWDGSGKFGHHVVCAYNWHGIQGVIDTNGHRRLTSASPAALCAEFTAVYTPRGYRYTEAHPTPYPF